MLKLQINISPIWANHLPLLAQPGKLVSQLNHRGLFLSHSGKVLSDEPHSFKLRRPTKYPFSELSLRWTKTVGKQISYEWKVDWHFMNKQVPFSGKLILDFRDASLGKLEAKVDSPLPLYLLTPYIESRVRDLQFSGLEQKVLAIIEGRQIKSLPMGPLPTFAPTISQAGTLIVLFTILIIITRNWIQLSPPQKNRTQ